MPIVVSQLTMLMLILILVAFPTLLFKQVFLFTIVIHFVIIQYKDGYCIFNISIFNGSSLQTWGGDVVLSSIYAIEMHVGTPVLVFAYRICTCIVCIGVVALKYLGALKIQAVSDPKNLFQNKPFIKILLSTRTNVISVMYNCKTFWILKTRKYF